MNDFMYEQLVARKAKATDYLIRVLMIAIIIILIFFGLPLIGIFAILLALVAGFASFYFVFPRLKVEYEYILLNHDLQIDVIYNKAKRKTLIEFDIRKAESITPVSGSHGSEKTYDFTSGTGSQPVYSIRTSLSGQNVCILIEPDAMMKESMNKWLAPHMQLK